MIGLLLVAAAIVAVVTVRLHRDLRRADARRRHREFAAALRKAFEDAVRSRPIRLYEPDDVFERNKRLFMAEERIAMSVMRPTAPVILSGIVT